MPYGQPLILLSLSLAIFFDIVMFTFSHTLFWDIVNILRLVVACVGCVRACSFNSYDQLVRVG